MTRPLRICFPGAVYHVIARGNAGEPICTDDYDRRHFVQTLARTVERCAWICHAYCLLDNRYDLVVETPKANLPHGMRLLNGHYAQRFNERYGRCGHLFQSPYRSSLLERESLLQLCADVVLDPVRAGICRSPDEYAWSSYRATAGLEPLAHFLGVDWILGHFAGAREQAQSRYRAFVHATRLEPPLAPAPQAYRADGEELQAIVARRDPTREVTAYWATL